MHDMDVMYRSPMYMHRSRRIMHMLRRLAMNLFPVVPAMMAYLGLHLALGSGMGMVGVVMGRVGTMVIAAALVMVMTALAGQR